MNAHVVTFLSSDKEPIGIVHNVAPYIIIVTKARLINGEEEIYTRNCRENN
jgi:PHD/YefM family antitoxin component YafN of YafNO toxin-antitoxin module